MIKIEHPANIVRDREKSVSSWEGVRLYRYANGVECQILIGQLPHGHVQSAISANRALTVRQEGRDLHVAFSDVPAPLVDFMSGDRLTAETDSAVVIDPCRFIASAKVTVQHNADSGEPAPDGKHLVTRFDDGTTVSIEPHGNHGHVEATRDGKPVKTFFNGKDGKLYVFDAEAISVEG